MAFIRLLFSQPFAVKSFSSQKSVRTIAKYWLRFLETNVHTAFYLNVEKQLFCVREQNMRSYPNVVSAI